MQIISLPRKELVPQLYHRSIWFFQMKPLLPLWKEVSISFLQGVISIIVVPATIIIVMVWKIVPTTIVIMVVTIAVMMAPIMRVPHHR